MTYKTRKKTSSSRISALALLASLFVGCSSSNTPPVEPPPPTVAEQLQTVIDRAVADGLPGVSLAVKGDSIDFSGVAGVADLSTQTPVNVDDRFYLASVGKTYTAVALVRLAGDGLLNLDDPITRWLPATVTDRIPLSDTITVRSLLNHTSGIFDYMNDGDDFDAAVIADPTRSWTNTDVLPFFLDRPLHFEPLTDYDYSDSNYALAGLIAEAASGLSISNIIRNYIVGPLGLQSTVHGNEANGLAGLVHGYLNADGELIDLYPLWSQYGVSEGGMQASSADLAAFVRSVLTDDIVLSDAMRSEFLTPSGLGDPPSVYALGIHNIAAGPGKIQYSNAGKNPGARADFVHLTSADESITIAWCASAAFGDYDVWYEQFLQAVIEVLADAEALP